MGATCAIGGSGLLLVGTILHPMDADPHESVAAFTEYAADPLWVASHLTQLAGVALMVVTLLILAKELEAGKSGVWSRIGATGAIASLALAAALQAVDGVALKVMVNDWAAASASHKEIAFQAAFAVRQVEVGFASMFSLLTDSRQLFSGLRYWLAAPIRSGWAGSRSWADCLRQSRAS